MTVACVDAGLRMHYCHYIVGIVNARCARAACVSVEPTQCGHRLRFAPRTVAPHLLATFIMGYAGPQNERCIGWTLSYRAGLPFHNAIWHGFVLPADHLAILTRLAWR